MSAHPHDADPYSVDVETLSLTNRMRWISGMPLAPEPASVEAVTDIDAGQPVTVDLDLGLAAPSWPDE